MNRKNQARKLRRDAAQLAFDRTHPTHVANGDEQASTNYAFSFTKGFRHDHGTGLLEDTADFDQFVIGIDSGDPNDFVNSRPGYDPADPARGWKVADPNVTTWRAWESQGAGLTFELEGHDSQSVTMPPAPVAGSAELLGEIGEVYAQALLRDVPLRQFRHDATNRPEIDLTLDQLNQLEWFDPASSATDTTGRRRTALTRQTAFRGLAPGDTTGPYLSQFLLIGTKGLDGQRSVADGVIQYGAQTIEQKVRRVTDTDFMDTWDAWYDVQNGADLRGTEKYVPGAATRFITTGRDLATYVHYDALYQAYLNACLIMLGSGVPFDPGMPFQQPDLIDKQQGFAQFGGPHLLSLVTEVATRALKAVRFQKFNTHRRLRPEALAGRFEKADVLSHLPGLVAGRDELMASGLGTRITNRNAAHGAASLLLPMAFPEGSPMHPSYGAGHATVAGACVTILKAFFDTSHVLDLGINAAHNAYVANADGSGLNTVDVFDANGDPADLMVEGELNKLAANISIGRDWAGVHYFSDYWESLKMGEQIAIGILDEQKLCFVEDFELTIPLFEGGIRTI